jgi:hypothetical protein
MIASARDSPIPAKASSSSLLAELMSRSSREDGFAVGAAGRTAGGAVGFEGGAAGCMLCAKDDTVKNTPDNKPITRNNLPMDVLHSSPLKADLGEARRSVKRDWNYGARRAQLLELHLESDEGAIEGAFWQVTESVGRDRRLAAMIVLDCPIKSKLVHALDYIVMDCLAFLLLAL